jgi:hypothetical protein
MINNRPVGMLLAVSARNGIGKVLRFDALLQRAEKYMAERSRAGASQPKEQNTGRKVTDLAASANGGSISGWNTLPVDAEHRAINLVADDSAPHWHSRVEQWPAEVEVDLAGEKVIISRIELDAGGIASADELPGRIEIMVNASSSGRRWRSLLSREADFNDNGVAVFQVAPTWARQVKIAIGNSRSNGETISLRRIRVSNP